MLEAKQITKEYTIDNKLVPVVKSISFAVTQGQFVAIIGKSGSGKSTLMSILSGLDKPTKGSVMINNKDITNLSEDELAPIRNKEIGFVFQSFHLVPSLNALENIMFPAELRGDKDAAKRAKKLMKKVGLEKRMHNFPHQLSGGEKQRVAICRALINKPKVIFADEPTGNLDSTNGKVILDVLLQFHKEEKMTMVLVTHDRELARKADRVITLEDGVMKSDTHVA